MLLNIDYRIKTRLERHLLLKSRLRIDSRGIAMHSENLRIDPESMYRPSPRNQTETFIRFAEEDDTLSLAKDSSHNSSFELMGSMIPSYQPVNRAAGRGLPNRAFRSPSPCLFRSSFLGSASKVRVSWNS